MILLTYIDRFDRQVNAVLPVDCDVNAILDWLQENDFITSKKRKKATVCEYLKKDKI